MQSSSIAGTGQASNHIVSSVVAAASHGDKLQALCASLHRQIYEFLGEEVQTPLMRRVQDQAKTCLGVCEEALRRYSLAQLSLSYNGGKDCLVLLVCFLAALHTHHIAKATMNESEGHEAGQFPKTLRSVYIQPPHPFAAVEEFVQSSSMHYHLDLASLGLPMKAAFTKYLIQNPGVEAIFVGTRRTDPHGQSLTHFDETDRGWPKFMRIHPVIDWRYQEIWAFLRHLRIDYCPLYDLGYTSLGGITDTHPNPALRLQPSEVTARGGVTEYKPAYELTLDNEERLGRQ